MAANLNIPDLTEADVMVGTITFTPIYLIRSRSLLENEIMNEYTPDEIESMNR